MSFPDQSFVEFVSTRERSTCGYCKKDRASVKQEESDDGNTADVESEASIHSGDALPKTSVVDGGAWAHQLLVEDYAGMLDMGWRRSGRYLYKPDNEITCCPQYTIRLDVTKFKMSRTQKRVMRQMNEFLATGKQPKCAVKEESPLEDEEEKKDEKEEDQSSKEPSPVEQNKEPAVKKVKAPEQPLKKKEIRNLRFEEKCRIRHQDPDDVRAERREKEAARRRTITSFIDEARPDWKHKLELKVVCPKSAVAKEREDESFKIYRKYQQTVHNDIVRLAGFRRFLVESPLTRETRNGVDLGAFHIWYLLDDKLIAVSVVDILPKFLSAKYMFYDPAYAFLSLGTYTALREIEFIQRLCAISPELQYYYMGYYIHSCPKMRYKAKFHPSDLLCDRTFKWRDFKSCREILDASTKENGYATFCSGSPSANRLLIENMRVMTTGTQGFPIVTTFQRACAIHPEAADDEMLRDKMQAATNLLGCDLSTMILYFKELNPE